MADSTTAQAPGGTLEARYTRLEANRSPYLDRARQVAALTIPSLMPLASTTGANTLSMPFQSVGARGVNNLAAKLLLALFPPGASFFKLALDDFVVEQLAANTGGQDARAEFDAALGKIERSVQNRFEQSGSRAPIFQGLKHLIVAGNGLLQVLDRGKLKFHPLSAFVVSRDLEGNLLELVVKETLARESLDPAILALLPEPSPEERTKAKDVDEVDVFTAIRRKKSRWETWQEIQGVELPKSRTTFPKDKLPWLVLRFVTVDGEDYGRGYGEEYLGDLASLDSLTGSMVDFAAVAAKVLFLVNESGLTSKKKLQDAPNGAIVDGNAADITTLQLEKSQDFQVANAVKEEIRTRLEQAFLLASSVQRNAERVTAEEIRVMAGELEQTLGGIYSVLAQELQLPLVTLLMTQMQREGVLPNLPADKVRPTIVTGLEGLGRSTDFQRIMTFVNSISTVVGQETAVQYLNAGGLFSRLATSLGLDATGLVRSEADVAQMRAQAQQAELASKIAPVAVKAGAESAAAAPTGA